MAKVNGEFISRQFLFLSLEQQVECVPVSDGAMQSQQGRRTIHIFQVDDPFLSFCQRMRAFATQAL